MLLPAFQPPPGHIRSKSMAVPTLIRSLRRCAGTLPVRITFRNAIMLIAVGTTQLVVPGSQLQPYFAGSNLTSLSFWNFQRQNQFASRPLLSISQQTARWRWALLRPVVMRVNAARAVVHVLCCSSPRNAGQPPSLAVISPQTPASVRVHDQHLALEQLFESKQVRSIARASDPNWRRIDSPAIWSGGMGLSWGSPLRSPIPG